MHQAGGVMGSRLVATTNLCLHSAHADPGLGAVGDGLLVSRVEDVDELCIIRSRGAIVQPCEKKREEFYLHFTFSRCFYPK